MAWLLQLPLESQSRVIAHLPVYTIADANCPWEFCRDIMALDKDLASPVWVHCYSMPEGWCQPQGQMLHRNKRTPTISVSTKHKHAAAIKWLLFSDEHFIEEQLLCLKVMISAEKYSKTQAVEDCPEVVWLFQQRANRRQATEIRGFKKRT